MVKVQYHSIDHIGTSSFCAGNVINRKQLVPSIISLKSSPVTLYGGNSMTMLL